VSSGQYNTGRRTKDKVPVILNDDLTCVLLKLPLPAITWTFILIIFITWKDKGRIENHGIVNSHYTCVALFLFRHDGKDEIII
jgi:hypothetical protein